MHNLFMIRFLNTSFLLCSLFLVQCGYENDLMEGYSKQSDAKQLAKTNKKFVINQNLT